MSVYCSNFGAKQTNTARTVTVLQTKQGDAKTEVEAKAWQCPTCNIVFIPDETTSTDHTQNPNS
ncbi:MAG: hypothetical protein ACFCUE_12940 [Candidatus Bathyarchaeia archaeon]|jgi:hypothetical protein